MLAGGAVIGVNVGIFVKAEDRDLMRKIVSQPGNVLAQNTTPDRDGWTLTAALSDSKNLAFLRWAKDEGYDIPSLAAPAPAAATGFSRAGSPALRQLQAQAGL